jgi:drug/metabolite transporter (DMT)-like permease
MASEYAHLWPGVPLALGSALLFGITAPASKALLGSVDPQLLAGLLYLGAGVGLAAVHVGRNVVGLAAPEAPLRRSDVPWLATIVLFGGVLGPLLLMLGLEATSAASGSLLLNLEGLATMGIAWLVFRENVDGRLLAGAAAILLGAIVLSWSGSGISTDRGVLFVAAACLCWGVDNNLTRKLSSTDPAVIAMIKGLSAGIVNGGLPLLRGAELPSVGITGAALLIGLLGVGVSLVLFIFALRHLGTARTGAYFSLAPFIGAVVAIVGFNEPVTMQIAVAGLLMAVGLWLHLAERHQHTHEHGVLEHEHGHTHDAHHQHAHGADTTEPHSHRHRHRSLLHAHPHYPDLHHRHGHS